MLNNPTLIEETKVNDKVPRNYLSKHNISKVSFFFSPPTALVGGTRIGQGKSIGTIKIKACLPDVPHQEIVKQAEVL